MKNYTEVFSCGRGAGTERPYRVVFDDVLKLNPIEEDINVLTEKSGLAVKYVGQGPMSGFISVNELWDVYDRIQFANWKMYELELNPAAKAEVPYVFKMGNGFKGKSPEQCLLEGMPIEQLMQQRAYMEKNCNGKFAEQNRMGVQAIDRAVQKFREGKLESAGASAAFKIYDSGPRYFPKKGVPQPYQTEGWEMNIYCHFLDDNPWKVSWTSKQVTIQDNVIVGASNVITKNASLTVTEYKTGLYKTKKILGMVEDVYIPYHLRYYIEHKDDWRSERGQTDNG